MAQCKKQNDDGSRCSNRALPGSEFCDQHRERIQFRRPTATAPVDPPTAPPPTPSAPVAAPTQDTAPAGIRPTGRTEAPRLPGLRREELRGVLVGPQALIRLAQPGRLTEFLSGLSEVTPLDRVEVQRHKVHGDLVRIRPPDSQSADLSLLYDRIADAARLYQADFYVGEEPAFVRYRDREAPFGYDLAGKPGRKFKRLCLLGFGEPVELDARKLEAVSLRDVVLNTAPAISRRPSEPAGRIFVLCATELEKTFRHYFRSHHLSYRLIRIPCGRPQYGTLFEVEPVAAGATVPAFAIGFLRSFPRSMVFSESFQADRRRVLVEMGCTVGWNWPNTVGVFPENCLLTLTQGRDFPNLCLDPAPTLIDGDTLVQAVPKVIPALTLAPLKKTTLDACRFEIRFQRDDGPPAAPVALLLDERELRWLRRLLYRLPASEFSQYAVLPASPYSVILSDQAPLRDLPLGVAMKRVADSSLLIPCHLKLLPELPSHLLAEALNVKAGKLTFITEGFRCEADRTEFVPLSSLLHSSLNREPVALELQSTSHLPDLKWQMPEGLDEPAAPVARSRIPKTPGAQPSSGQAEVIEMALLMKSKAANLRSANDPLGAALYYALAGDLGVTAELLRQQAAGLGSGERSA
jgi:hypothetical protein